MKTVQIKENSWIAKIGATLIKEEKVALTIGYTIYLYNVSKARFLENRVWLSHELVHVKQFEHFGKIRFIFLYSAESILKGYFNNKYEIEARTYQNNFKIIEEYKIC